MGSQKLKKKSTPNVLTKISEITRDADLATNTEALQPAFELGYSPIISTSIDFVNVTDSVDPAQG